MKQKSTLTMFLIFLFLFSFLLSISTAQLSSLSPGDRIRITAPKMFVQPLIGQFTKIHSDSLLFSFGSKHFVVPFQNIEKIEISQGYNRNTKKGALIGAITGGLSLGLAAYTDASKNKGGWEIINPGKAFTGGFVTGAVVGAGLGAVVGRGIRSENWVALKIE